MNRRHFLRSLAAGGSAVVLGKTLGCVPATPAAPGTPGSGLLDLLLPPSPSQTATPSNPSTGGSGAPGDVPPDQQILSYMGTVMPWAPTGVLPTGWVPCNGASLPVNGNQAIFSIIGYTYGRDPATGNFLLPNIPSPDGNLQYIICTNGIYPPVGESIAGLVASVVLWAGNRPFGNAVPCNGQTLSIATYTDAYGIVGTLYGGDGTSTFGVPNLPPLPATTGSLSYQFLPAGTFPNPSEPPSYVLGAVVLYAGPIPWNNWLPCSGQVVASTNPQYNPALQALLGNTYGGSGPNEYGVPNIATIGGGVNYRLCSIGTYPGT